MVQHRIQTSKVLNNSYFEGTKMETEYNTQRPMVVHPAVSEQYDYAVTDDIVLLNERKDTAEKIYEIFKNSKFSDKYKPSAYNVVKIPKEDIAEVFNYTRKELEKIKTLTAIEEVIAINEFYEFNYDYVYKNVLTPQMKQAILEDYYTNQGMKARMDESASEQLF